MIRSISLATALTAALAIPAVAQTSPALPTPPAETAPIAPTIPTVTTAPKTTGMSMTAEEAQSYVGKPIYSSDNKQLGKVVLLLRGADNTVSELDADIGGFLAIGVNHVKITPAQFRLQADRVDLNLTAAQAKDLPAVAK